MPSPEKLKGKLLMMDIDGDGQKTLCSEALNIALDKRWYQENINNFHLKKIALSGAITIQS